MNDSVHARSQFYFANTALLYQTESDSHVANLCPGDDVALTCRTSNTMVFTWLVTDGDGSETVCSASAAGTVICGPMNVFSIEMAPTLL